MGDVNFNFFFLFSEHISLQIMKRANSSLDVKNIQVALETFNMEVEKQNIMQGTAYLWHIFKRRTIWIEQINDIMNGDVEEATDEDADKVIGEIELKVGGGPGGGVKRFLSL